MGMNAGSHHLTTLFLSTMTGLHEGWEQNINKLLHTATFTQQIIEFIQSQWLLLWVIVMVYRISMPWLCTLECVHTMQCTVQSGAIHYTHCTAHHEIKGIDRRKKNTVNNWKGSR